MTLINFDKEKIKEQLTLENIYDLIEMYGGNPEYTNFGILSATICHNMPGEGSRKLYYYSNSGLLRCYTGCDEPVFDIFELTIKVFKIQQGKTIDFNDAIRFVASKFNIAGEYSVDDGLDIADDWKIFDAYARVEEIDVKDYSIHLKDYDATVLSNLNYNIKLTPWLEEGITDMALQKAQIGYYPGADMITIPHFDVDSRFIGLRGRAMAQDDIERFGKYRPIKICQQLYNHPLGMNLYGLNWAKDNIGKMNKAIVFESEKSVLLYMSYFGIDNNIAVACCGSNISAYHIHMLMEAGAKEIIVAFDRQFQALGDNEFQHLVKNYEKLHQKYKNEVNLSFIFDKHMITNYKASPIDEGKDKFLQLFKERVILD